MMLLLKEKNQPKCLVPFLRECCTARLDRSIHPSVKMKSHNWASCKDAFECETALKGVKRRGKKDGRLSLQL